MTLNIDKKIAARVSKILTAMCVRSTEIEDIHSGITPISKTGDFSDVKVIDADGREILWNEVSRISDDEMKMLMKRIVDRLYTFFIQGDDPRFAKQVEYFEQVAQKWDAPNPVIDPNFDINENKQD